MMAYYTDWTNHPFDSGYQSSSTKKEASKSSGLLGSLKDFFKRGDGAGKKKNRKGIIETSSNSSDITDNYNNFNRQRNNNNGVSPYDGLSPNSFFTEQGVMKTSDMFFKPRQFGAPNVSSQKPREPDFEIPVASGPARRSIVGLFDNPQPQTSTATNNQTPSSPQVNDDETVSAPTVESNSGTVVEITTNERRSSVNTPEESHPGSSTASHSPPPSSPVAALHVPVINITSEEADENNGDHEETMKQLTPQCSDLSVKSEDPHLLYKEIQSKEKSRAVIRRGSLPNSIISDVSINSERSEGRRKRRRGGPKLIGPQATRLDDNEDIQYPAPPTFSPQVPPTIPPHPQMYYMGGPRYMPPPMHAGHPYMPYPPPPHLIPGGPHGKKQVRMQPTDLPPPNPAHHRHPSPYPPPQGYPPMYGYPMPSPVMFQPLMEETTSETHTSGHDTTHLPGEPLPTAVVSPRKKKAVKVGRSKTMDSARERPTGISSRRHERNKKSEELENDESGPKGFDDFALY